MVGEEQEEGEIAKLLLADPQLVQNENDQSPQEDQSTRHKAIDDPTLAYEIKGQLLGNLVVTCAHLTANVLPRDVDHAGGHQEELHGEGIKDFHAFPESEAGRVGATFIHIHVGDS